MGAIWRTEDRLKTLAFALAGCGCWMSYEAAGIASTSGRLGLLVGGFVLALGGVVLALEIGNRPRRELKIESAGKRHGSLRTHPS